MYLGRVFGAHEPGTKWAINSVGECHPHTVEVRGSNPRSPTIYLKSLVFLVVFRGENRPYLRHF